MLNTNLTLSDADALAGIAKPARASVSIGIHPPMNAEGLAGFVPKGTQGLLEACSRYFIVAWGVY